MDYSNLAISLSAIYHPQKRERLVYFGSNAYQEIDHDHRGYQEYFQWDQH